MLDVAPIAESVLERFAWSDALLERPRPAPAARPSRTRPRADEQKVRFLAVVLPHLGEAHDLARFITGSSVDADDVVQDACLRAFRGILAFSNGNARRWVLTIVRHSAYHFLRKNRRADVVLVDDVAAAECTSALARLSTATPEAALIAKADAALVERAIAAIPAPFRETLVLRELEGLDYREIAAVTGVPIGTVMSRLARARTMLGALLLPQGGEPWVAQS